MSIITSLRIGNDFSNLENNIVKLKLSNNEFIFRIIIYDSIKLLSSILELIKNKNNLFEKNIPKELFVNIISFLPYNKISICQTVCTYWQKILKSDLSKKLISIKPKKLFFDKIIKIDFCAKNMFKIKKCVYVSNYNNICEINTKKFELVKNYEYVYKNIICSNNNYVCRGYQFFCDLYICLLDTKLESKILLEKEFLDVQIDNDDNILITTNDQFYIYNVNGSLIKKWDLFNNKQEPHSSRKITSYKNEIYMLESCYNQIHVFSYEGKKIRSWGSFGNESGHFINPQGITINQDIVFVVDTGNNRIQAFTCCGKYIFQCALNGMKYALNIIFVDNYAYINDYLTPKIARLKLIWD